MNRSNTGNADEILAGALPEHGPHCVTGAGSRKDRLMADEQQRYRDVIAINSAIAGADGYDEVLRLVVERTAEFTEATACVLLLGQPDGSARIVRSSGIDPARAAALVVPMTERLDREVSALLGLPSSARFIGAPIIGKEGLVGILAVYRERPSSLAGAVEDELLSALADQAAIALDNSDRLERLAESEDKLASIISVASDAIISIDERQNIRMFNDGAEKLFGWSRDDVLGKPLDTLLPERFRTAHRPQVTGFATGPLPARRMAEHRPGIVGLRANSEEFPAAASISRVRDAGAWLYTVVLRDITEQKRREDEQRFLAEVGLILATSLDYDQTVSRIAELAVRDLADLCIVDALDEDSEIRRFQVVSRDPSRASLCALLMQMPHDRRRPHLMSSALETRRPILLQSPSPELIASLAQSEEHHRALRAAEIRSMVAVPLLAHGTLLGAMAFISSTRTYGPADVHLAEELALRAALAIETARLYRAARRATAARDEVLGVVAHDLRSPLAAILLEAGLLRRQAASNPTPTNVDRIERAAGRMERLIEDLLDVARMEAGKLSVEVSRVAAPQLVADAVEAHRTLATSRSVELGIEVMQGLSEVSADRDRLLQVFQNLIGNALKFVKPGGRITVAAAPGDHEVLFSVTDTGCGISPEDVPHVFDRFWQSHKAGRRGAGLGLSIVKAVIDAHRGRVWVESTLGRGSTFYFSIPAAAIPPETTAG